MSIEFHCIKSFTLSFAENQLQSKYIQIFSTPKTWSLQSIHPIIYHQWWFSPEYFSFSRCQIFILPQINEHYTTIGPFSSFRLVGSVQDTMFIYNNVVRERYLKAKESYRCVNHSCSSSSVDSSNWIPFVEFIRRILYVLIPFSRSRMECCCCRYRPGETLPPSQSLLRQAKDSIRSLM